MINLTEKMAEFCKDIKFEKLPNQVVKKSKTFNIRYCRYNYKG